MGKIKHAILISLIIAWAASLFYVWSPALGQSLLHRNSTVHAQAVAEFTVLATVKTDKTVVLAFTVTKGDSEAKVFGISRQLTSGAPKHIGTSNTKGFVDSYTDIPSQIPPSGSFSYLVKAYRNQADADAEKNDIGSATSNTVNPSTTTTPPTTTTGSTVKTGVSESCTTTAGTAATAGIATGTGIKSGPSNSLFAVIAQDGTRRLFRWILSLVNFLVLIFLLAVAFANILRISVDTYAVKRVLPSLIMGVILANFSWLICRFFIEFSTILYHYIVGGEATEMFKSIARGYGFDKGLCGIADGSAISAGLAGTLLGTFVGTVLILIAGILILTLYVLLWARVWIVTLLIIIAPLAFLSLGFPMTQQFFKRWWTLFLNWTFMAPASFLILRLADASGVIGNGPNITRFIIVTALIYFAIQVPFKMGGDWMRKWGDVVSQFKKKAGAPIEAQARKSYEGYRDEALNRARYALWKNPIGTKVGEMRANTAARRKRVETDANAAARRGEESYAETEHGKAAYRKLGRSTERTKRIDETLKVAEQEGVAGFKEAGSPEAKEIGLRLAEMRKRQEAVEKELESFATRSDLKFGNSDQGKAIQDRLSELAHESELEDEETNSLLDESRKRYFQNNPVARQVEQDLEKRRLENKELVNYIDRVRGIYRRQFRRKDFDAERKRRERVKEIADEIAPLDQQIENTVRSRLDQLNNTAKDELKANFAASNQGLTRGQLSTAWAKYFGSKQGKADLERAQKAKLAETLRLARDTGEGLSTDDQLKYRRLQSRIRQVKDSTPGSLAATAALAEKKRNLIDARLTKYDEQAQADSSTRIMNENPDVAIANARVQQARLELQNVENNPLLQPVFQTKKQLSDQIKDLTSKISATEERLSKEIENDGRFTTNYEKKEELARRLKELEDNPDDEYTKAKQTRKARQDRLKRVQDQIDPYTKDAEKNLSQTEAVLEQARIRATQTTPEGRAQYVSTQDSMKEDLSRIEAWFSQSKLGDLVNNKRAIWRTTIASNEQIADEQLSRGFYNYFRVEEFGEKMAKAIGTSLRNFQTLVDRNHATRIIAQEAKELMERESSKGTTVVLEKMLRPQNFHERIDSLEGKLNITNSQIATLKGLGADRVDIEERRKSLQASQKQVELLQKQLKEMQEGTDEHTEILNSIKNEESNSEKYQADIHNAEVLKTTNVERKQYVDDLQAAEKHLQDHLAQTQKQYGSIEAIPYYLQSEYAVDKDGQLVVNRNFNSQDIEGRGRARRVVDRRITMLAKEMQQAVNGTAEGRTDAEILREIYGTGNDVKDIELVKAILRGDQTTINQKLAASNYDYRIVEKALRFLHAGLKISGNFETGENMRNAFYGDLLEKETLERLVVQLNKTTGFKDRSERALGRGTLEKWVEELETNNAFTAETLQEVREKLRKITDRTAVGTLQKTLINKVMEPLVKTH